MSVIRYRPEIDGLRAIAVISVLFYHVGFETFRGGFVGVDIFFVISGFLITRLIRDEVNSSQAFSFSNFYLRRVRRLVPALLFTLGLSSVCAYVLLSPQHLQIFGGSLASAITSLSNFYFWRESGYFDAEVKFKPLLHTWSLCIEEQFYLFWPLLVTFLLLKKDKRYLLGTSIALFSISLLANLVITEKFPDSASTIYYLAPFRVFEFMVGAVLVELVQFQTKKQWVHEVLIVLGLIMILFPALVFTEKTVFPSYNA
ncbi:MAG TPA: acyltransferase, partial [Pseudobdellovibrionaceae bacterium]